MTGWAGSNVPCRVVLLGVLTLCELVLQLGVADGFGSLTHLPQQFLQTTHAADYTP